MRSAAEFLRETADWMERWGNDMEAADVVGGAARLHRIADDIDAVIPARGGQVTHGYHDALKRIRGEA